MREKEGEGEMKRDRERERLPGFQKVEYGPVHMCLRLQLCCGLN